ncbi:UNVERIFIED_ORG: hypothetical protein ABIC54_003207 [Burkholderia sp. 1263]
MPLVISATRKYFLNAICGDAQSANLSDAKIASRLKQNTAANRALPLAAAPTCARPMRACAQAPEERRINEKFHFEIMPTA